MTDYTNNFLTATVPVSQTAMLDKMGYQFPDPFLDMASMSMPRSHRTIIDLCEAIWLKNGTYRMASSRIIRYFLTKIEFEGIDDEPRKKLETFMNSRLRALDQMMQMGDDLMCYGNSLSSVVIPFRRFLVTKESPFEQPIEQAKWEFKDFKWRVYHPKLKKWCEAYHIDRRSTEEEKIKIKRWSPREIKLQCHPWTQRYVYYWDIPPYIKNEIRRGNPFYVQDMPWEVIQTIQKNEVFKFNPGVVYHMKEDVVAGFMAHGWGISRMLSSFAQAWYCQILKRYNEALALDYVVPFRVITPAAGRSSREADPLLHMNTSNFVSRVNQMIRQHRTDPATWHTTPFPLEYQALGGEAQQMSTPDLIDKATDELLNSIGIPAELYRGSLQIQAMPVALRLFQQTWPHIVSNFNGWLDWSSQIICTAMSWDKPEICRLQPVTLADDIELRQIWLQLASANMISRRTAFAPWGIDAYEEQRKIFDEQRKFQEEQQKFQEDMQNRQSLSDLFQQGMMGGGQPGQPGMPPGQGGGMGGGVSPGQASQSMSPMDMVSQAQDIAQQLVTQPQNVVRKQLNDLKQSNEALYSLVKSKMQEVRQEASSQGRQQIIGQMAQQQQGGQQ